jgi:hypothetical protein
MKHVLPTLIDIKKLMRQCRNTLKDKIAAAEAAQAKTPQGEARKREASDEDRDVQRKSCIVLFVVPAIIDS